MSTSLIEHDRGFQLLSDGEIMVLTDNKDLTIVFRGEVVNIGHTMERPVSHVSIFTGETSVISNNILSHEVDLKILLRGPVDVYPEGLSSVDINSKFAEKMSVVGLLDTINRKLNRMKGR